MSATLQKDTCYFSHDANAKDDYKCMLLIDQMGLEGYGIFWILIETLREQKNYKYPLQLVPSLARKYNTTQAKMETVINAYGLFEIDEQSFFFSGSLNRRMSFFEQKKQQQIEAGKKGVAAKKAKQAQLLLELSDNDSINRPLTDPQAIKEKEKKEKESKENFKLNPKPKKEEQEQGSFEKPKPKVKLNLSDGAAEFRQKLINSKYVGTCAEVVIEGEKEYVFINEQGRLYTKSRSDKQLVSSTLNEIWEQLHELHVAKYGAKTNPIQNLQIKKFGA
ncbi:DUF4373 domain-containing protein [Sulfurimonas sp.]|uniref:DUF4373 domain-containing protein n=1 Tax=Sulfurimonas sp. TaxID=2022749 RepID=UPI0025D9EEC0|nr:DUF4373 domain-containing protein [Sulfurimonas sp.]MCK9454224.1 DUF4373 domain-containing protein [Sulfurimonas sp.]